MRTAPVVGLTGWAGAGKSTVANLLAMDHGYVVLSLAAPIIEALRALDPIVGWVAGEPVRFNATLEGLGWDTAKRTYTEVRRLAQRFGTEVGRQQFGQDVWVERVRQAIRYLPGDTPVVIPDVRFPNEAKLVHNVGGTIARVERPGLYQQFAHESEQHATDILPDFVLLNNGDLTHLRDSVRKLAEYARDYRTFEVSRLEEEVLRNPSDPPRYPC